MKVELSDIRNVDAKRDHGDIGELKQSISNIGLINPITVDENNTLMAGRRRFQAVRELGWTEIEAVILPVNGDRLRAFKVALDENLKRKSLTDPEVREAIAAYDELKRQFEGEQPRGRHRSSLQCNDDSWAQDQTAAGLKRQLEGESDKRRSLKQYQPVGYDVTDGTGWSHDRTAADLGISRPSVSRAVQASEVTKEIPRWAELSTKKVLLNYRIMQQQKAETEARKYKPAITHSSYTNW